MSNIVKKLKRFMSHDKNREKQMAIIAAKTEQAIKDREAGVIVIRAPRPATESIRVQMEKQVMSELGISREITQENVRVACASMLKILPQQYGQLRRGVGVNLPGEIRKVLQGRTAQEAYDFYWSLPEFREVWPKLGYQEVHLRKLINTMAEQVGKELI